MKKIKSVRKLIGFILISLMMLNAEILLSLNTGNIVAYPVPFNPRKGNVRYITIGNSPDVPALNVDRFKIEVYDINGDLVCTKNYTSSTAIWNGRNSSGRLVSPGLYIIKVTVENTATGEFGKKLLRVLINY